MKFKTGDKVQTEDRGGLARDCEVVEFIPRQIEPDNAYYSRYRDLTEEDKRPYEERVKLRYEDDNSVAELQSFNVHRRDSELERKFRLESNRVQKEIDEQLSIASAALSKAEEISEQNGIPFSSSISPLGQSYFPTSFDKMWGAQFQESEDDDVIDEMNETISNITGAHKGEYQDSGWEHSAVC